MVLLLNNTDAIIERQMKFKKIMNSELIYKYFL